MGKRLIIKGADFSINAVENYQPIPLPTPIFTKIGSITTYETTSIQLLSENTMTQWTMLFKGSSLTAGINKFLLFCNYTSTTGRGLGIISVNENLRIQSYNGSGHSKVLDSPQTPQRFAIKRNGNIIQFISSAETLQFEIPVYSNYYMVLGGCTGGTSDNYCEADNVDLRLYDSLIDDVSFWFE